MTRYTIAPGETIDYAFDFNGPSPGPALKESDSLTNTHTVTPAGGVTVGASSVSGNKVLVRLSCPDAIVFGTRCTLRCLAVTVSGEVLIDTMDLLVAP